METKYDFKSTKYWSISLLQKFLGCAADVKAEIEATDEPTDALIEGTAFHSMIEKDFSKFIVFNPEERPELDKNFGSKLNKEWKKSFYELAEKENRVVIDEDTYKNLEQMIYKLWESEIYKKLKSIPLVGVEQFYKTELNGIGLKCKPDHLSESADEQIVFCVDWKKTKEKLTSNPNQLKWIIKKYNYHLQACHYTEILRNVTGKEVLFCLVFVQNTPPFNVVPVLIKKGSELYEEAYLNWMTCCEDAKNFNINNPETLDQKIKRLNNDLFIKL